MTDYLVKLIRKASKRVAPARTIRSPFPQRETRPARQASNLPLLRPNRADEPPLPAPVADADTGEPKPVAREIPALEVSPVDPAVEIVTTGVRRIPVVTPSLIESPLTSLAAPAPAVPRLDSATPPIQQEAPPPERDFAVAAAPPEAETTRVFEPSKDVATRVPRVPRVEFSVGGTEEVMLPFPSREAGKPADAPRPGAPSAPAARVLPKPALPVAAEDRAPSPRAEASPATPQPAPPEAPWPAITLSPQKAARPPAHSPHERRNPPEAAARETAPAGLTIQHLDVQIVDRSPEPAAPPAAPPPASPSWPGIDRHHVGRIW